MQNPHSRQVWLISFLFSTLSRMPIYFSQRRSCFRVAKTKSRSSFSPLNTRLKNSWSIWKRVRSRHQKKNEIEPSHKWIVWQMISVRQMCMEVMILLSTTLRCSNGCIRCPSSPRSTDWIRASAVNWSKATQMRVGLLLCAQIFFLRLCLTTIVMKSLDDTTSREVGMRSGQGIRMSRHHWKTWLEYDCIRKKRAAASMFRVKVKIPRHPSDN